MHFDFVSAVDLVRALISIDDDDFTFETIDGEEVLVSKSGDLQVKAWTPLNSDLCECAALFTRGHMLGSLYQRNETRNELGHYTLLTDENGNYIPTDPPQYLVPDEGIILSSGNPIHFNMNDRDDMTTQHQTGGDPDLHHTVNTETPHPNEHLGASWSVYDACTLQFEFRCTSEAYVPELSFRYSFGSEEYYEYVHSDFNDVFGFYLNGQNLARIPSTETVSDIVSINNVNYLNNSIYFHGNDPGTGWETEKPNAPETEVYYPFIEADGFTDILTAYGVPYTDGVSWNTIKLAIGDVGDDILDSWVLLESGSFSCVDITMSPSVSSAPSSGEFSYTFWAV